MIGSRLHSVWFWRQYGPRPSGKKSAPYVGIDSHTTKKLTRAGRAPVRNTSPGLMLANPTTNVLELAPTPVVMARLHIKAVGITR